jgi:hypothetical protein
VGSKARQESANRITIANDDTIYISNFARLCSDAQSAGCSDERESRLWTRTGNFKSGGTTRFCQRAMCEKGAAPCSLSIADSS